MKFEELYLSEGYNNLTPTEKEEINKEYRTPAELKSFQDDMALFDQLVRNIRTKNENNIDSKYLIYSQLFLKPILRDPNSDIRKEFDNRLSFLKKEYEKVSVGADLSFEPILGTNFEKFALNKFGDKPKEEDFNIFKKWCDARGVSVCVNEKFVHFENHYPHGIVFRKKGDNNLFMFNKQDRDGIVRLNKTPNAKLPISEFAKMFNLSKQELEKVLDGIGMSSAIRNMIEKRG